MMLPNIPLLGFAAYSGTGKTTLLEALLPKLTQRGLRVGALKHAHHDFDIDKPGKDSYRLRKAGANQMVIASHLRYAKITETPENEAEFTTLLQQFDIEHLDLILVEGCKNIAFPKIELHRESVGKPWLYPHDDSIIAVASDQPLSATSHQLTSLNINDIDAIATFVTEYVKPQVSSPLKKQKQSGSCDTEHQHQSLSVNAAIKRIIDSLTPVSGTESVPLNHAQYRTISDGVTSSINVPAFCNSAMDGYAIRSADIEHTEFQVVANVLAGHHYSECIQSGQAVKIMTGAPLPEGADTVIMREQAQEENGTVRFPNAAIKAGQNVRQPGEDLQIGQTVFESGQHIGSAELGMLAALGLDSVNVKRRLKVAVFSTGDEVFEPGNHPSAHGLFDANRYSLKGLLTRLHCDVLDMGILPDNLTVITDSLTDMAKHVDLIVTSGGVSVGDADFVKQAMEATGQVNFWRINMRPGRPLAFGRIKDTPIFGLPGNPVAAMVSFINFVEPAVYKMQGNLTWQPLKTQAKAVEKMRSRQGRTEFSRGIYTVNPQGQLTVSTTGHQGSGLLHSMSQANCLIEIAEQVDTIKPGEYVTIIPLQGRI